MSEASTLADRVSDKFMEQLKESVLKEVRSEAYAVAYRISGTDRRAWEYKLTVTTLGEIAKEVGRQCAHDRRTLEVLQYAFERAIREVTEKERDALVQGFVSGVVSEVYDNLAILESLEKIGKQFKGECNGSTLREDTHDA